MPLVIVAVTAIVDAQGPEDKDERQYFPNVGTYQCFPGYSITEERPSFFATPEFLYFELYLLIINIANLFFFGSAIKAIRAAYINREQLR